LLFFFWTVWWFNYDGTANWGCGAAVRATDIDLPLLNVFAKPGPTVLSAVTIAG
jgi:hypothetical protein